ncbi:MAG: uracil-DNA glycosylase [Candidatus Omnitrophota bacterium]
MTTEEKIQKIEKLRAQIAKCQRCRLHQTRTNTVPGEGDVEAKILFIGEAPGRNEDLQGKPFVGRAGDVFDRLLESIGLTRQTIYLCNILKCRPPENRAPLSDEIQACVGSLDIQLKVVDSPVIAPMGNFAVTYIFQKFSIPFKKISDVHGKVFQAETPFGVKKVVPLFHPAVATYDNKKIDILLKDFQVLKDFLVKEIAA